MVSIANALLPTDIQIRLGAAAKAARLAKNHSRLTAASLTGVPVATLKSFETTGDISLRQLVLIARTYGQIDPLLSLFGSAPAQSLDDLIAQSAPARQRGRK